MFLSRLQAQYKWGGGGDAGEVALILGLLDRNSLMLRDLLEPKPKLFCLVEICVLRIVPHGDDGISNGEYTRASKFFKIMKQIFTIYFKYRV
jgi:hypothetical protein